MEKILLDYFRVSGEQFGKRVLNNDLKMLLIPLGRFEMKQRIDATKNKVFLIFLGVFLDFSWGI